MCANIETNPAKPNRRIFFLALPEYRFPHQTFFTNIFISFDSIKKIISNFSFSAFHLWTLDVGTLSSTRKGASYKARGSLLKWIVKFWNLTGGILLVHTFHKLQDEKPTYMYKICRKCSLEMPERRFRRALAYFLYRWGQSLKEVSLFSAKTYSQNNKKIMEFQSKPCRYFTNSFSETTVHFVFVKLAL